MGIRTIWTLITILILNIKIPEEIIKMHDSYFRRLWNNESGCLDIYEEGFEEAYEALEWKKNEHQD